MKIERYRKQWEALGAEDPYWAVISDSKKKNGRWDKSEFFDISDSMVSVARAELAECDNIKFMINSGDNLMGIAEGSVDFIYSNMVLQHTPKQNQCGLIQEFCRVLRPGGTLVFQTPSQQNLQTVYGFLHFLLGNRILNIARRMWHGKGRVMEMHTINQKEVLRLLKNKRMDVVAVEKNNSAGYAFISYLHFAVKK